jgi:ABC-type glycerol-3-phosphate transport system substrate-binding protein
MVNAANPGEEKSRMKLRLTFIFIFIGLLIVLPLAAACGSKTEESAGNVTPLPGGEITEATATQEPSPEVADTDVIAPDIDSISAVSELESTGTLRIALYHNDDMFKRALEIFDEKYPGWEVEIVPLTNEVEEIDAEGNVSIRLEDRNLNVMALLNSNSVDVVNTVWYNAGRFIASDRLEDLSLMFQDDVDYNMNRLLPGLRGVLMTAEGKLPLLPVSFQSLALLPNDGMTIHHSDEIPKEWTWYEMLDWFENDFKSNGIELLFYASAFNFMDNVLLLEYMDYIYNDITKEADFDAPALTSIAMLTKHLLDTGRLSGVDWKHLDPQQEGMEYDPEYTDFLFKWFTLGENVVDYSTLMTNYGQAYPYPYIENTEGKSVTLDNSFGINARSSASTKRAAWELLKILISDEIQNSGLMTDSSVISELTKEGVARNLYGVQFTQATEEMAQGMIDSVTQELLEKYNSDRMTYFEDINQLSYRTADLLEEFIFNNTIPYFKGRATLEECIETMKSRYTQDR